MRQKSHSSLNKLGPLLTVSENWAALQAELEARALAQKREDASEPHAGYHILQHPNGDTFEYYQIDDEFYAGINNFILPNEQSFAFIGEDWIRAAWMVDVSGDQELLPFGHGRVPSYITPASLQALPGYCDFEVQPDNFIKVERFRAKAHLKWVSIAMSRRALQRALGEMDSHIPAELDHYLNRDASVLMMRKTAISAASMGIVRSLFEVPLLGNLRYKFFGSQIHSLLYMTLGSDWHSDNRQPQDSAMARKILRAAEQLRYHARTGKFDAGEIANNVGLSRSVFDHGFSATYGKSPGRYWLEEKLKYAAELLITTDMPIKQISIDLGYDDQGSFSRCFRKWSGLSPSQFRARHQGYI
ncbi:MAG TPA: helix-turn-helix transcriptional regulator [Pedomonas sp.]|uniref:helix-turn-helix transcriptional regulator n=1 Tax=Pedomonas sp. TaxID=2976421 RepID=UPI002F40D702